MATKKSAQQATAVAAKPAETKQVCKEGPIVIVIDPGHGDIYSKWLDGGATYPNPLPKTGGWQEKDLALGVSKALKTALEKDATLVKAVYLTREGDLDDMKRVRFKWRIAVAKEKDARVFISIHLDSPSTTGGQHIIYRPSFQPALSLSLAQEINKTYKIIAPREEAIVAESLGVLALGTTNVKAGVLIETGFISATGDRTTIDTKPASVATEIAAGVHAFIKANLAALCTDTVPA
jgi:N-acetylmuramoyl-L-alanine amidase